MGPRGSLVSETYPLSVLLMHHIQNGCHSASHRVFIPASRPQRRGRDRPISALQDTAWKLPSIGQNAVTWPYLPAGEDGECHSSS